MSTKKPTTEIEYKIGDKIRLTTDVYADDGLNQDSEGIIKNITPDKLAVEFKKSFDSGHTCGGCCKDNFGYWVHHKEVMAITPNKKDVDSEYKPGMSIEKYVKQQIKNTSGDRQKWLKIFNRCVLPDNVKQLINESITILLRADMFDKWGINDHFEKGLTNSILIYGASGTGKTMVAESISAVLNKNLMKLDSGDIQSQIPGQTQRNIKESFEKADKENCVLLLDECDSLLYDRNSVGAIMSSEINALLTEIENFKGVIILTTNRLNKLDSALQRRIIAKIELPNPSEKARRLIWETSIPKKTPLNKDVDFKELARANLSGGEIKNAFVLSVRKAISKNKDNLDMDDLREGIISVLESKEDYNKSQIKEYGVLK